MDKKFVEVLGRRMAYVEAGAGRPIVFQHGNPTSSYLWRNIIPHLSGLGRCIAVDLIGMGDSDKLPEAGVGTYSYEVQRSHLHAAWDALGIADAVLVLHDWGGPLGFHWARERGGVAGIAYMETIAGPVPQWEDWPEVARKIFQLMRSEAGEELVLDKNVFVERVLPASIMRTLSQTEMAEYRRPFAQPGEGRRPTLDWPRHIPIAGEPAPMVAVAEANAAFLAATEIPKLFINAEPGSMLVGTMRAECRTWRNQTEVTVKGTHFIQEDSPDAIGAALAAFVEGLT
ncbi:MAG: haloalkane dehalogenase [Pseudomonadota bacterium]